MIDSYTDTFSKRGFEYDLAMQKYPDARCQEFRIIAELAKPQQPQQWCDYPSGGGYLSESWQDTGLTLVETSEPFYRMCAGKGRDRLLTSENVLPFADGELDGVVSLAGIHHNHAQTELFREVHRVLKTGGLFVLADVGLGMPADKFLNEFVHQNSASGHRGVFIGGGQLAALRDCGYEITHQGDRHYHWIFDHEGAMAEFCQLLFGLNCPESKILDGIQSYLGYRNAGAQVLMNWGLYFIVGVKQ